MAGLNNICCIDKIFRDIVAFDETRLVGVNERGDKRLYPSSKNLGGDFNGRVLQRDWSVVVGAARTLFFGNEDNVRSVEAA